MKKRGYLITAILCLFLISFLSATTYQQSTDIDLKIPTNETLCNLTVAYPNSTNFIENQEMTLGVGYANYTINSNYSYPLGAYQYFSNCLEETGNFRITPSGNEKTIPQTISSLAYLFLLIFITIFFTYLGFKLTEAKGNLWVIGVFFMFLSLLLIVYDIWLGYEYYTEYADGRMIIIIFYISLIAIGGGIAVTILLLLTKTKEILKWFGIDLDNNEDEWDENNY